MRDMVSKMAELKFEAPLAQFEESDEWGSVEFQSSANRKAVLNDTLNLNNLNLKHPTTVTDKNNDLLIIQQEDNIKNDNESVNIVKKALKRIDAADNFTETFSGSLEDLVNTFDDKITKCFGNYEESVANLAPVQVRTQEEIMNECQMWWTITGNFGNILPIDWSKSYARKMHVPALNLGQPMQIDPRDYYQGRGRSGSRDNEDELSSEDEAVASDLDMHALILGGFHQDAEPPVKTADEVIREIDDMMDDAASLDRSPGTQADLLEAKECLNSPLYEDKLRMLSATQLNELYLEMEVLIREFSETLISELALRDELEYEKELKNTFISLLLAVQNRRRQYHVEKKRGSKGSLGGAMGGNRPSLESKYLTTVIPYHIDNGLPDNQALQVLIKILKAINDDSPTVPTLLTDYILKILCPT